MCAVWEYGIVECSLSYPCRILVDPLEAWCGCGVRGLPYSPTISSLNLSWNPDWHVRYVYEYD